MKEGEGERVRGREGGGRERERVGERGREGGGEREDEGGMMLYIDLEKYDLPVLTTG